MTTGMPGAIYFYYHGKECVIYENSRHSKSGIANLTLCLTDRFKHVNGACTLLDKVLSGMVAKPRS